MLHRTLSYPVQFGEIKVMSYRPLSHLAQFGKIKVTYHRSSHAAI